MINIETALNRLNKRTSKTEHKLIKCNFNDIIYITDGYIGFKITTPINTESIEISSANELLQTIRLFNGAYYMYDISVELPTAKEIKSVIRELKQNGMKRNEQVLYSFGKNIFPINVKKLLMMYEILGDVNETRLCTNICTGGNWLNCAGIWAKNNDGNECVVLPVRKTGLPKGFHKI